MTTEEYETHRQALLQAKAWLLELYDDATGEAVHFPEVPKDLFQGDETAYNDAIVERQRAWDRFRKRVDADKKKQQRQQQKEEE